MLHAVTDPQQSSSYTNRLREFSVIILELVSALQRRGKRQKLQPDPLTKSKSTPTQQSSKGSKLPAVAPSSSNCRSASQFPSPTSDTFSYQPHHDNHSAYNSSSAQQHELGLPNPEGPILPNLYDPATLTPSLDNSEDKSLKDTCTADDFSTLMARYERGPSENFDFWSFGQN